MDLLKLHLYAKSKKGGSGGGIIPSGELLINENGIYDVIPYASVNVEVSASGGGAEGGTDEMAALVEGSITSIKDSKATKVRNMCFRDCMALVSVDFSAATMIGNTAFQNCTSLVSVSFPEATNISISAFYLCSNLTEVDFPKVKIIDTGAFQNCSALTRAHFPNAVAFGNNAFSNCTSLIALVLRKNTMCALNATGAFYKTPIADGNGYIYVPAALIEEYKAATNWSTYATQFRALEDYTVDGTVTGALDESKI